MHAAPAGKPAAAGKKPDAAAPKKAEDDLLDLVATKIEGGTLFALVDAREPKRRLGTNFFWRAIPGQVAAETAPVRFRLGGDDLIAPRQVFHEELQDNLTVYPIEGRKLLEPGRYVFTPGNIVIRLEAGSLVVEHPAIRVDAGGVGIRCAPVRFAALDAAGAPRPVRLQLKWGNELLLREDAPFSTLVAWLPVGLAYSSTLGDFRLPPDGKIDPNSANLARNVELTADGLLLKTPAATPPATAPAPAKKLFLTSHRERTVFTSEESAVFTVFAPKGFVGGEVALLCELGGAVANGPASARSITLGAVALPAVTSGEFDSRQFTLRVGDLPPGEHQVWLEGGGLRSEKRALTIVSWQRRSSFLVHSISHCTGLWPTSDEGLRVLSEGGLEMLSGTGFQSVLDTALPTLDPRAERHGAPAETLLRRAPNDLFLERMLRHRLRSVDLAVVRAASFYNEGLSYHHSYAPSVDRMVRRMQLFAQQTADYPSFWGVNYSWFPQLFGYTEGGVPTDAHTGDRNRALAEAVAAAGFTGLTADERKWYQANKFSTDPATAARALELMSRAVTYWKAQQDLGWAKHNRRYNDALREVRPDTVCTLFENAGHDSAKRTRSLFADNTAVTYGTYTDYGDWPMSAGFTTDWARGNFPGRPVWLTTCWGTSPEGQMKSLFHAFGRGLAGGGVPLQEEVGLKEIARRGKGLRFACQYGAIATHATPDARVAILSTAAEQLFGGGNSQYIYHALYTHLTRLGCAPVIVADEDVVTDGVPATAKVLFIVRQQQPFEAKVREAIAAFQQRGGKVIQTADCLATVPGAITVAQPIKSIWQMSGFAGTIHGELWEEFAAHWRGPLTDALAQAGVAALATTDPDRGYPLTLDAGPVRYVVVIADAKGKHSNHFEPVENLPVTIAGAGWIVRDLVKQETLATKPSGDRTEVAVNLTTEPTTILACYRSAPATVQLKVRGTPAIGGELAFTSEARDKASVALGPVPMRYEIRDAAGKLRDELFRAAGEEVVVPVAAHDAVGPWKIIAQELLTGVAAVADVKLAPNAAPAPALAAIPEVHVVNEGHLRGFLGRAGEKWVIVEPGQSGLLPLAQTLVAKLQAAGLKARLWQVAPEQFDTVPVRWYSRSEDATRVAEIGRAGLIGYRESLKAFIDTKTRSHVPVRGGYTEIAPHFMVGGDCIVFAAGRLAESLREVSPWLNTPNVPGRGQGRLLVCFSPFTAGHQALAVLGNDSEGLRKAVDSVVAAASAKAEPRAEARPLAGLSREVDAKSETLPVPQPYRDFTPLVRTKHLLAARNGKAAVFLAGAKDTLVFVDETGAITGSVDAQSTHPQLARLDAQGRVWDLSLASLGKHPSWHFDIAFDIALRCLGADGTTASLLPVYSGETVDLPPGYLASFQLTPDGALGVFGRQGGLMFGKPGEQAWRRYDDMAFVTKRYMIRNPRFPVGLALSPDAGCAFFTMDTRPSFGGMGQKMTDPTGVEAVLLDTKTGRRLWALGGKEDGGAGFAALPGFAAVARAGALTALADYHGAVCLVDKTGRIVAKEQAETVPAGRRESRPGPPSGVGVWLSDGGELAVFAFRQKLVLGHGGKLQMIPLSEPLVGAAVAADGSLAFGSFESGEVRAFRADGTVAWSAKLGGAPQLAAVRQNELLCATAGGELICLDASGKETRRTAVAAAADREKHPVLPLTITATPAVTGPLNYQEADTLALAQAQLGAKPIAAWKSAGDVRGAFGREFYPVTGKIELAADAGVREAFVHLVYRRSAANQRLAISTQGADGPEEFLLDLATPEYRVVDVPVRGPNARITVSADGPVEIAECSLWSFRWPGANRAFVPAVGSGAADPLGGAASSKPGPDAGASATLDDLVGDSPKGGGSKQDAQLWRWNIDPDQVAGRWLKPSLNPFNVIDGRRFGNGRFPDWNAGKGTYAGAWIVIDLGKTTPVQLVATYDRASKQSQLNTRLAVFTDFDAKESESGTVLAGTVGNDQFWRLFPLRPGAAAKLRTVGVHCHAGGRPEGLSEVEVY